jgi:prepilin-type N-terminal cleavage/methylation domain-containing protein
MSFDHERAFMRSRSAFTIVELLVVISIVALLVAMLLPALGKAKYAAKLVRCAAQQKQIGIGLTSYAGDNRSYWPARVGQTDPATNAPNIIARRNGANVWDDRLIIRPYFSTLNLYNCPMLPLAFDLQNDPFSSGAYIMTPYSLFYGWRIDQTAPKNMMAKQDDRFTWAGVRFNVLVKDEERYTPLTNDLTTAHPDNVYMREWRSTTIPRSIYWTFGGVTRAPLEQNTLFDDGSVTTSRTVVNDPGTYVVPWQVWALLATQDYTRLPAATN